MSKLLRFLVCALLLFWTTGAANQECVSDPPNQVTYPEHAEGAAKLDGGQLLDNSTGPACSDKLSFESIASEDGWVRESQKGSGVGGRVNHDAEGSTALTAGDNHSDRQFVFVLSFDTSSIPDNAVITQAVLKLTRGRTLGENPFKTHGAMEIDIKTGTFGTERLEGGDFEASADITNVTRIRDQGNKGKVYTINLARGVLHINKSGRTQLRLRFCASDDNDSRTDLAGFYPGDSPRPIYRPRLTVTYRKDLGAPDTQANKSRTLP